MRARAARWSALTSISTASAARRLPPCLFNPGWRRNALSGPGECDWVARVRRQPQTRVNQKKYTPSPPARRFLRTPRKPHRRQQPEPYQTGDKRNLLHHPQHRDDQSANSSVSSGATGQNGTRNAILPRSSADRPRRIAKWASRSSARPTPSRRPPARQSAQTPAPASGGSAPPPPAAPPITTTVIHGTPLLAMRWKLFGASPLSCRTSCAPRQKSLLIAEILALITMIFRMVAAAGIPRPSKNQHERTARSPKLFHGKSPSESPGCRHRTARFAADIDRLRDHLLRILRFRRGHADNLDAAKGKHHDTERGYNPSQPLGAKPPWLHKFSSPVAGKALPNPKKMMLPPHNHGNNRHHFDQRQPELHLAENAHAAQVHGADKKDNAQHPDPAGNIGIPAPYRCRTR